MDVAMISEFLTNHNQPNRIDKRLRPARIVLDCVGKAQIGICISDGYLVLEDLTKAYNPRGYQPLATIELADPDSFDKLLRSIGEHYGQRHALGTGSAGPGCPTNTDGSRP